MADQPVRTGAVLAAVTLAIALIVGYAVLVPGRPQTAVGPNGHALVRVAAGRYWVGAEGHTRNPRRLVNVDAYDIATTETTNAQFARFVEATGYVTDAERAGFGMVSEEGMLDWQWRQVKGAHWRRPFGDERLAAATHPDHPVTQISGADAAAYSAWAGGRLPTVEEWEIAARAGVDTRYPWGDELMPSGKPMTNIWHGATHYKNEMLDKFLYTAPVKSFPPNRWGLYDVIGNVFEYCDGGVIAANSEQAAQLTAGRGGSWWCSKDTCNFFNLADIGQMYRHGSLSNQGFRIAMSPKSPTSAAN